MQRSSSPPTQELPTEFNIYKYNLAISLLGIYNWITFARKYFAQSKRANASYKVSPHKQSNKESESEKKAKFPERNRTVAFQAIFILSATCYKNKRDLYTNL